MGDFRSAIWSVVLLLEACASSPAGPERSQQRAAGDRPAPIHSAEAGGLLLFDVDGKVPTPDGQDAGDALFASGVNFGVDDDLLRYRASYRLEAGDLFSFTRAGYARAEPTATVAGQSFGHNVVLRLPELAGAPLSLRATTQVRDEWLLAGETRSQRRRANLTWSPGPATVEMEWSGRYAGFDPLLALNCKFAGTVQLPVREGGTLTHGLRVSGRECIVAESTQYAGIPAQTWALGYVWHGAAQLSEARLRVIDPVWTGELLDTDLEPGYQLGLSHRRDFGALSAEAVVAFRQAPSLPPDLAGSLEDASWSANATLTWHLAEASLSANWAQGVNPLWFVPDVLEQRDRFGLALDLSRWIESVVPESSPELGVRWDWSRLRLPGEDEAVQTSLTLDLDVLF